MMRNKATLATAQQLPLQKVFQSEPQTYKELTLMQKLLFLHFKIKLLLESSENGVFFVFFLLSLQYNAAGPRSAIGRAPDS